MTPMDRISTVDPLLERAARLAEAGDAAGAYAAARAALDLRPDARQLLTLAARLALDAGHAQDAVDLARESAQLDANDAEAAILLGRAAFAVGRLPEAIEALQRAIRLSPDDAAARVELGRAWLAAAEPEKALPHLRRAAALDPRDTHGAGTWLAAAEGGPAAELPPAFVRALFDQYADRFDAELRDVLGYRAPEALAQLTARIIGAPGGDLDVLDLGCGTGLSGESFRPFARALIGVDLSPRMAEKARARGLYARVDVGDMTAAMNTADVFHLIVAVDALGYVGDLAPIFRAAQGALRPGGRFAATVETNPDADAVVLSAARRFRHGENHVRRIAVETGFAFVAREEIVLRRDRGQPVAGLAFVLARTG